MNYSSSFSHIFGRRGNSQTYAMQQNTQQKLIIPKISKFLQMKNIHINEFWQSARNYASVEDLKNFCLACGLKLSIQDQINLKNELFFEQQVISIYDFCQLIQHWKGNSKDMVLDFLKKRSEMLIESIQEKDKNRIKSSHPKKNYSIENKKQVSAFKGSYRQTFVRNNSKSYLLKFKEKQKQTQLKLSETIDKNKNQYQYQMLIKMAEANDICKTLNSNVTYRAYKNAEGNIRVRIYVLNKYKDQIKLQQFDREFKSLKQKTKENKEWNKKENIKNYKDKQNDLNAIKLKKQNRQKQIQNLLVQTVSLTDLLKQQIRILKNKGIYGSEIS